MDVLETIKQVALLLVETGFLAAVLDHFFGSGKRKLKAQEKIAAKAKSDEVGTIAHDTFVTLMQKGNKLPHQISLPEVLLNGIPVIQYVAQAAKVSADVAERALITEQMRLSH